MARPKKKRTVCFIPTVKEYGPLNQEIETLDSVAMSIEEFESIRLMDYENLGQEMSSEVMAVARSTFQRIYNDARKKIAYSLVHGHVIRIEGGEYEVCNDYTGKGYCFPQDKQDDES